jgi:hypothetical protein
VITEALAQPWGSYRDGYRTGPELHVNDSTGLFPTSPDRPRPEQTATVGPWGGPTYSYRGARIECMKGGHVCGLFMLHGCTFGVVGTITPLVDLWLDEGRLPDFMRAVPQQGGSAAQRRSPMTRRGPDPAPAL